VGLVWAISSVKNESIIDLVFLLKLGLFSSFIALAFLRLLSALEAFAGLVDRTTGFPELQA